MKYIVASFFLAIGVYAFAEENRQPQATSDFTPEYLAQVETEKAKETESLEEREQKIREHDKYMRDLVKIDRFRRN